MFEIGEKVICVDDKCHANTPMKGKKHPGIDKGKVYTIAGFAANGYIFLEETFNNWFYNDHLGIVQLKGVEDGGWRKSRFRKLLKKKTDISIFHEIRNKVEQNKHIYSTVPPEELEKML